MAGETDCDLLIRNMRPMLDPEPYVFCTFADKSMADLAELEPIGLFAETEGVTAILPVARAVELGLAEASWYRRITLMVHSSLAAVGLTAAVSTALGRANIACNIAAAFYHDHIFIAAEHADDAMRVLLELADEGKVPDIGSKSLAAEPED